MAESGRPCPQNAGRREGTRDGAGGRGTERRPSGARWGTFSQTPSPKSSVFHYAGGTELRRGSMHDAQASVALHAFAARLRRCHPRYPAYKGRSADAWSDFLRPPLPFLIIRWSFCLPILTIREHSHLAPPHQPYPPHHFLLWLSSRPHVAIRPTRPSLRRLGGIPCLQHRPVRLLRHPQRPASLSSVRGDRLRHDTGRHVPAGRRLLHVRPADLEPAVVRAGWRV